MGDEHDIWLDKIAADTQPEERARDLGLKGDVSVFFTPWEPGKW